MTKYDKATAAAAQFFATHTPAQVVEKLRQVAPHAFEQPAAPTTTPQASSTPPKK